jgi:hypothetical protein
MQAVKSEERHIICVVRSKAPSREKVKEFLRIRSANRISDQLR